MTAKDFALLMGLLVTILISAVLFGKCNCTNPKPPQVTMVDSISTYYKPVLQILHAQRLTDSFQIVRLQHQYDSLAAIKTKTKASIAAAKQSAAAAQQANDTPALLAYQQQVISNQDTLIEQQEQQLTLQSNIIQRQETTISNYATEVDLHKGIAKQVSDQNTSLKADNIQLTKQNHKLSNKIQRKNTVIKVLVGAVIILTAIQTL